MSNSETRHRGHVKFFNVIKGYGFILPEDPKEKDTEVFVHHTVINNAGGFKSLAEGELVEYDLTKGPKGLQASNVTGPDNSFVQGDSKAFRHKYHRNRYNVDSSSSTEAYTKENTGYMVDPYYNGGYIVYYGQFPSTTMYNGQDFTPNQY